MSLGCYAYCFISTAWVSVRYARQIKCYEELAKNTVEKRGYQNMTIEEILSTKDGFDLLADHLVKEFCIENLLFIFDMMQIKNQLISTKALEEDECGVLVNITCARIKKMRRDSAVIMNRHQLKSCLQHIVDQYIAKDGEYSINIKSKTRLKILEHFASVHQQVHNIPKYDWIKTEDVHKTTTLSIRLSKSNHKTLHQAKTQSADSDDEEEEETSDIEMNPCPDPDIDPTSTFGGSTIFTPTPEKDTDTKEDTPYKNIPARSPKGDKDNENNGISISCCCWPTKDMTVERQNGVDDDMIVAGPTFEWMGSKGMNTLDIQLTEEDNKKMLEYLRTFDNAMNEIVTLLNGDSLLRFYETNDYQRILREHMALNGSNGSNQNESDNMED